MPSENTEKPDPLQTVLLQKIAEQGPLTIAEYMALCLGHPEYGYYKRKDPFGVDGDFITAPEISQMFGEILGAWSAHSWAQMKSPPNARLVEIGPGRGTLLADALRAIPRLTALTLHLVETSPVLRDIQAKNLKDHAPAWHDNVDDVPDGPAVILSNELFDALPIRQIEWRNGRWQEIVITAEKGRLTAGHRPLPEDDYKYIPPYLTPPYEGAVLEISPWRTELMQKLARRIAKQGGVVLLIDYGHTQSDYGDTLQAVRAHTPVGILEAPGHCDLTSHVDFESLMEAAKAEGAETTGPIPQGQFLIRLGIVQRAKFLREGKPPSTVEEIDSALHRLIDREEMGDLFKVMCVYGPGQKLPAGFTP